MPRVQCFPPIADAQARILILGSMPGEASLRARQYYAHPRNAFWPIFEHLFRIPPESPYAERIDILKQQRVAVWDVLKSCHRDGSGDAEIHSNTLEVNDFAQFFRRCRAIQTVAFNGQAAERYFQRHVQTVVPLPA